jgi:predicted Rossmann fold nucleotide-binding protein DprA/Smf involved in DNA uptake
MQDGTPVRHPRELQLNEVEKSVLAAIGDQPTDVDKIANACGLEISRVLSTLSVLEIHGFIVRTSQRSFARRRF